MAVQAEPKARKRRYLGEQQSVSSMSMVAKLASISLFGSIMLGSSLAPAYALRMPESADTEAKQQQTVSAYAGDNQSAAAASSSLLSPDEIHHIQWCAARYVLKYDPVSDTYAGAGGIRLQCRSPR
jgi:hypothetical protein